MLNFSSNTHTFKELPLWLNSTAHNSIEINLTLICSVYLSNYRIFFLSIIMDADMQQGPHGMWLTNFTC